jgi:DNA uptake protein ComE-like DNA-binding protein
MRQLAGRRLAWALALFPLLPAAWAQDLANVVFLEPVSKVDTGGAEIHAQMPVYRLVADPAKYAAWLHNESAERALRLYRAGYELTHPGGGKPDYFVALVPGGNHASVGFRMERGTEMEEHARQPYILLDAQPYRFESTLLHETGHVVMAMLAGGRPLESRAVASIPHSTAALSDRTTAFSEGYAIHLETVAAHLNRDAATHQRFHRELVSFGEGPFQVAEYYHQSADLASFSQNVSRYLDVRDNNFAFEAAFQGPDYLRVQLEKARDFATVRDADQLLQSEGFYASFFFLFAMRGSSTPAETVVAERERQFMTAMQAVFAAGGEDSSAPWLLRFAVEYMKQYPEQKAALVDALNDLSHGVFVDAGAAALWRDHYLATLRLDQKAMNLQAIAAARKKWREQVVENPQVLFSRIGPEIACSVPGTKVRLVAFEEDAEVRFDLNTAQAGIMRLIPGITEAEVASWLARRAEKPFAGVEDFRRRAGLRESTLAALKF